jgi:DNA-directed RNA polymerase specialized sigma24 family protein
MQPVAAPDPYIPLSAVKTRRGPLYREAESRDELFASTRWATVLKAGDSTGDSADALSALSELCQIYWRPLYVFLCQRGFRREDAQDLTQGFFAHLIAKRGYSRAEREKGRFRSFLLAALKNFTADVRAGEHALKRGGGMILKSLDDQAEAQTARVAKWETDEVYDREWAACLVRQALNRLAQERALAGKAELFTYLMPRLAATEQSAVPYEEIARQSHRAVTTLKHELARLRTRYRAILREEVRATLRDPADVDEELRHLIRALSAA